MTTKRTNTRNMHQQRKTFHQQGKQTNQPCWLCNQPINYNTPPGTTPDSHELDHYYPVSTHPHLQEDPANFRHTHKKCNQQRGNKTPKQTLGTPLNW